MNKTNRNGRLTPRQKELLKELYNSWPNYTTHIERVAKSFKELWQPYYRCIPTLTKKF